MNNNKLECLICKSEEIFKTINYYNYCKFCFEEQEKIQLLFESNRKLFYPEINQINEYIYLGNYDGARDKKTLLELGVTHILMCGNYLNTLHPNDFIYKKLPIDDSCEQEIFDYLIESIKFIENSINKGKIYVHCHAGISRSATMLIGYFMWKNKITSGEALKFIKVKRNQIFPNFGFREKLKIFEEYLIKNDYNIL